MIRSVIEMEMKCKNCGHRVEVVGDNCFHVYLDYENLVFSKECNFNLQSDELKKFEEETMKKVAKDVIEKFGDYKFNYWFFELQCACKNPECDDALVIKPGILKKDCKHYDREEINFVLDGKTLPVIRCRVCGRRILTNGE